MTHVATKVVIITEKLIQDGVTRIIEEMGGRGYTITPASGKGSRNIRSSGRPAVVDAFSNIKIEVITGSRDTGTRIAEAVTDRYFSNYSGITYIEEVEIVRRERF